MREVWMVQRIEGNNFARNVQKIHRFSWIPRDFPRNFAISRRIEAETVSRLAFGLESGRFRFNSTDFRRELSSFFHHARDERTNELTNERTSERASGRARSLARSRCDAARLRRPRRSWVGKSVSVKSGSSSLLWKLCFAFSFKI